LDKTLRSARHRALIGLLVERREAVGLTQAELAARLCECLEFVARVESGERHVDVVEFLALAEILRFDPLAALLMIEQTAATDSFAAGSMPELQG
jgi:transcriptional regulator with XRE-family HTH domain